MIETSLVVAVARNRVIGRDNQLPWRLPDDLKFFKRVTMGKPVIMGRRTYESIGKALPGRQNIMVTRNADYQAAEGVEVVTSLKRAVERAEEIARETGAEEASIIGGAEIFLESLGFADRIYLTEVHAEVEGDVFFPEYDRRSWREVSREDHQADEKHPYDFSFVILERETAPQP